MENKSKFDVSSHASSDHNVGESRPTSWLQRYAEKLSIETGGIQRVTDEERQHNTTHVWNATTFWFSANFAVATLSTGMVGPSMGLNFWDSFAIIMVVNVLACMLPAWTATFGLTGLRMTTFSRYSFGYWGNCICVAFSLMSTTGWNAINSISGASCLAAVSGGALPVWAGVIIITVSVWSLCVGGIRWIHKIDSFLWISPLVVWCIAAGTGAGHLHGDAVQSPKGANGAAVALSYIAVVFSFAVSWINCAADYNVRMPVSTARYKIFAATYAGITLPSILVMTLGAALYTGAQVDPTWKQSYSEYGVGGPLAKALEPAGGFGKFCLVLAGLSSIPVSNVATGSKDHADGLDQNNIPNNYSFALHAQNFGPWAIRVPRIAFVTVGFIVATVVGCVASISFESSLLTVLSIVGYWTVVHLVVVAEEHIIFRRCRWSMYNWDAWDKPDLLPFGWGAIGAFVFGFLGAALGMKVTWYRAPIAALIGKNGGNIGHELTFAFSAVAFPLFRWTEKRWSGK